jgi:hypothetical protein
VRDHARTAAVTDPIGTAASEASWLTANQRYLTAALTVVRVLLETHAARGVGAHPGRENAERAERELAAAEAALPAPSALHRLVAAFGLSAFERDVLLMCAGIELDGSFGAICADAHGDGQRPRPTFGMALAAHPQAQWSALAPAAALRGWHLIEPADASAVTTAPLRIDERVLHFLTGVQYLDERLRGVVEPVWFAGELPPSQRREAERIVAAWSRAGQSPWLPLVQLCGDRGSARRIAAAASGMVGLKLHVMELARVPGAAADADAFVRLWEREAIMSAGALLIECGETQPLEPAQSASLALVLERTRGAVFVAGPSRHDTERASLVMQSERPTTAEQRELWRAALANASARADVEPLLSQFDLSAAAIGAASAQALAQWASPGMAEDTIAAASLEELLWGACRGQARPRLDRLAQRIEPSAGWDDLVLPDAQRKLLGEITLHLRRRSTVYDTWGFARAGRRGLGISVLFEGRSGTGKTMAAEALAAQARLDLYRIDLSQVVSKYIGETEKNLSRIFDAAEAGGAVLLFDEADAIFGRRSEVRDSHDRYANVEISYLLQRMEAYRGLAILTTNMKSALDTAFLRRIRFVIHFPSPGPAQRAQIWRKIFPPLTPLEGLDVEKLARLNVAGGEIRNIALNAAFLAADAGEPVRMTHLLEAARSECVKLERQLPDAEIAGWI